MATPEQVAEVRLNTDEPRDSEDWTDTAIDSMLDALGGSVSATSAAIWRKKAAAYAKLVDVSEAGASHKFSDLHRNALEMAKQYDNQAILLGEVAVSSVGHARVKVIDRAYNDA